MIFTGIQVLGKLGPNSPNHVQGHTESSPVFSIPHFTLIIHISQIK